jgi:glutamate-5-semialdehyde dehydrogenase
MALAAVAQLGAIARQAGTPSARCRRRLQMVVDHRRPGLPCTRCLPLVRPQGLQHLNTLCLPRAQPPGGRRRRDALRERGEPRPRHPAARAAVPPDLFTTTARLTRGGGARALAEPIGATGSAEWSGRTPVTVHVVDDTDEAIRLFRPSPRCRLADQPGPGRPRALFPIDRRACVGSSLTRWLDGQFALERPELGLTNWRRAVFGRHSILTGDGVYTVRLRVVQTDPNVHQ